MNPVDPPALSRSMAAPPNTNSSTNAAAGLAHADAASADLVRRYLYPNDLLNTAADDRCSDTPTAASDTYTNTEAAWWLVYTKSRQEKRLSGQLTDMGLPHYLPVHTREAFTRGRARVVEEPLFSGYLFLYGDDDQRRAALTTNRISTTHPVADPRRLQYELSQIARSIAAGAHLTLEAQLEPGDWVRVKSGLHEGLEGTVLRRKNETKLVLSVNFLGQGASLEVADYLLEEIDPPQFVEAPAIEIVGRRGL